MFLFCALFPQGLQAGLQHWLEMKKLDSHPSDDAI